MMQAPAPRRRSDIDLLRVGAFALLILYHAGMPFSGWGWHINDVVWPALREAMLFVNRWRMALVFFVAGAGIMLALGSRGPAAFARDRLTRLGLPLVFGMAVIVPPQVWAERAATGAFTDGFLAWLPHAYAGVYPAGNLSWHHLWFLPYVLTLSLVLLPVFMLLRSAAGGRVIERATMRVGAPAMLWLLVVPSYLVALVEHRLPANKHALLGDWAGLQSYGLVLLIGAVIYRCEVLVEAAARLRWGHLLLGVAAFVAFRFEVASLALGRDHDAFRAVAEAVQVVNAYAIILALAGFARHRFANLRSPWLGYATEAVFPFYILHQTITVLMAFALLETGLGAPWKFAILCLGTFAGSWILHEGLVRRVDPLRPLFGLKRARPRPTASASRARAGGRA